MKVLSIDDLLAVDDAGLAPERIPTQRTYDWTRLVTEGRAARKAADGGRWRIGQLASLVERRYRSGALVRFADAIGESLGSVRRFRWVTESYDANARLRFHELSFSHFQAVAALPDRLDWLARAQRRRWSVDTLTLESRKAGATSTPSDALVRKPIEAAIKRLARLSVELEDAALPAATRRDLARAVEQLAHQVEALRRQLSPRVRAHRAHRTRR
jgi:hypothetical protein